MLTKNIHRKSGDRRFEERLIRKDFFRQGVVMVNLTLSLSFQ